MNISFSRLRIRSILLIVNVIVILVPFSGIYFFKLYENELIRQTESELIAQGAYISALFRHEIPASRLQDYGTPLPNPPQKLDETYNPIPPRINLTKADILLPRPDAVDTHHPIDPLAMDIGGKIMPIIQEARLTTLAGISVLDVNGTVIFGSETGLSLAHLEEVKAAMQGHYHSVIRMRFPQTPSPPLASISRSTHIRIFAAMPILQEDRLVGVVVLSRSPRNVLKALYEDRSSVIAVAVTVLIAVLLISLLTSHAINQPIRALLRQVRQGADGHAAPPIAHPITYELAVLSQQINLMAKKLHERSDYIRNFAMHVSHEFKTPLTSIQGALELLEEHGADMSGDEYHKFLHNTLQDTNRLKMLVSRLLELARADNMQAIAEPCITQEVITPLIRSYAAKGLQLTVKDHATQGTISMPADIFATILVNLLDNSLKNGADTVEIYLENDGNALVVTLKDNGTGISEANAARLFTPFFTTQREQGGTGLGLTIVRALLTSYQGSIELVAYQPHAVFRVRVL